MPVTIKSSFAKMPTAETPGLVAVKIVASDPVSRSVHIGLLTDSSGSMEGDRITSVKRTISVLLDHLNVGDKITLIGFSNKATTIFKDLAILADSSQKAAMNESIDKLTAGGGTNMECGIVELGSALQGSSPLNALVLLTDGHINEGISSCAGLHSLIKSYLKSVPVFTLGYGTDHNADLLKTLSQRTQANYTFIQDEISLPVSIGDMLGALQTEVASESSIGFDNRWSCAEPLAEPASCSFDFGSLIADKPVWAVFNVPNTLDTSAMTLKYKENGVDYNVSFQPADGQCEILEIVEQELRCLTGVTLNKVTEALKVNKLADAKKLLVDALSLIASSAASNRGLVILMKAQLDETLENVDKILNAPRSPVPLDLLYRTTSLGGNYSAQRGVTQMADATSPGVFSSPAQIQQSQHMTVQYSQGAGSACPQDPVAV